MHIQISLVQGTEYTSQKKICLYIAGSKQGILYESYLFAWQENSLYTLFYVLYDDQTYFIPRFKIVFRIFYLFIHRFVNDIILWLSCSNCNNSMKRL